MAVRKHGPRRGCRPTIAEVACSQPRVSWEERSRAWDHGARDKDKTYQKGPRREGPGAGTRRLGTRVTLYNHHRPTYNSGRTLILHTGNTLFFKHHSSYLTSQLVSYLLRKRPIVIRPQCTSPERTSFNLQSWDHPQLRTPRLHRLTRYDLS
jgi:hypothetical protein